MQLLRQPVGGACVSLGSTVPGPFDLLLRGDGGAPLAGLTLAVLPSSTAGSMRLRTVGGAPSAGNGTIVAPALVLDYADPGTYGLNFFIRELLTVSFAPFWTSWGTMRVADRLLATFTQQPAAMLHRSNSSNK